MLPIRRPLFRVIEGVLICATGFAGYKSCSLDRVGDPERAMPAMLLTVALALSLLACLAVDFLLIARPSPAPKGWSAQVDLGEGAAMTSAVAGVLAWIPLIPVTGPVVYAAIATLTGLFALRELRGLDRRHRDQTAAILGVLAGAVYMLVWLVFVRRS
jgi:hypothetical protein